MDKIIKILKIISLTLLICLLVVILVASYVVYMGVRSGDLKGYLINTVANVLIDKSKLSPTQADLLESGNYEELVNDIGENVTQTQIDCAVEALGEERANEILVKNDPTPQELLKLSKCL